MDKRARRYKKKHIFLPLLLVTTFVLIFFVFSDSVQRTAAAWYLTKGFYNTTDIKISRAKQDLIEWMDKHSKTDYCPNSAIAVVYGDTPVFIYTSGNSLKLYEAASLTKTITVLAVLMQAERGRISLDNPVKHYIPFPVKRSVSQSSDITPRELLHHTSGLNNNYKYILYNGEKHWGPEQTVPSGYRVFYSNTGYNILGNLIEGTSGRTLYRFVTDEIVKPLGMDPSSADTKIKGSMGFSFSIDDAATYLTLLIREGEYLDTRLISKKTFQKIFEEPVPRPPGDHVEYRGLAWNIWKKKDKIFSYYHGGLWDDAGAFIQVFPQEKIGFVILSNPPNHADERFSQFYRGLKYRLSNLASLYFLSEQGPWSFTPVLPRETALLPYTGEYHNKRLKKTIRISLIRDRFLAAQVSGDPGKKALLPMTSLNFVHFEADQKDTALAFDFVYSKGKIRGVATSKGYYKRIK